MRKHKLFWIGFPFLLAALAAACLPIQPLPAPQKVARKGTATRTPFLSISTFTPTTSPMPSHTPEDTRTPIIITLTPSLTKTGEPSPTPGDTASPSPSASASATPLSVPTTKPSSTPAPDKTTGEPQVRVSVTTNCRTGPGTNYPRLSPLQAGKKAAILGRDAGWSYWIIKDPGKTGQLCWLWGYYGTTSGNLSGLKVYQPPTPPGGYPTPGPSQTPSKTPVPATKSPSTTPRPTKTFTPQGPTPTPNLTPGTATNTLPPPTATPIPSATPVPPTATPIPDPGYCAYTSVLTGEEAEIRSLINQARTSRGLPKLKNLSVLITAARDHGRDMTCHGTYSHTSTDGTRAWERISVALGHGPNWCYNHCCCSEIFYGGSAGLTPQTAFNWWMTHPSADPNYKDNIHKRTILSKYSTHLGVGVIYYQKDGVVRKFYTVDFARP